VTFLTNMKPGILRTSLLATLSLLAVAGCSPEAGSSQPAPAGSTAKGVGVLETSAGAYEFTPMTCAVHKEDGVDDIEVAGPGTAVDLHFNLGLGRFPYESYTPFETQDEGVSIEV